MVETIRDMEEGKIKPQTVFKHLVGPIIGRLEHVRDEDDALEKHKKMSPVCKEFCAEHGDWKAKENSQDPFMWVGNDVPEPMYDSMSYPGAYDWGYNATATAVTMTTTLPPGGECRVEVECELYEVLDAPDTRVGEFFFGREGTIYTIWTC